MKRKRLIIIFFEFILLTAVLGTVYHYTDTQIKPTKVYAFNANMITGEVITKDKLTVVEMPASAVNENFLRDKDLVIGNVVTTNVSKGQFVLTDLVTTREHIDPFKTMDLTKMRKVSFAIDMEKSLAGNLKKGDVVDLAYITVTNNDVTGEDFVYAKTFMPEVVIWSVNTDDGYEYIPKSQSFEGTFGATSVAGEEVTSIDDSSDGDLASITVAVTGPQAEEIMARAASGTIQILGRFPGAEEADSTGYVLNQYSDVFAGNVDPENGEIGISVNDEILPNQN